MLPSWRLRAAKLPSVPPSWRLRAAKPLIVAPSSPPRAPPPRRRARISRRRISASTRRERPGIAAARSWRRRSLTFAVSSRRRAKTPGWRRELERTVTDAEQLRERIGALEAALTVAEGRIQTSETALAAAEAHLRVETVARATLEDELDRERAVRAEAAELRAALEAEREARRAAEEALANARAEAETTLQERIAEPDRRAAAAPELERVAREHAGPREPAGGGDRLVADLDAAAEALRNRAAPGGGGPPAADGEPEPPAPDAEPAVEWGEPVDEPPHTPCVPGVEPARPRTVPDTPAPWTWPGYEPSEPAEAGEPPAPDAELAVESAPPVEPVAPDAEPAVESALPVEPPPPEAPQPPEPAAPPADASAALPTTPDEPSPAPEASPPVAVPEKPAGPIIVSASGPPACALATGSERRNYPLLRGAIVKLAHDDPAAAAALLAALLPAQGVAIEGPLAYDLTIREAGSFAVTIAGGRASVEPIDVPRPRSVAAFHLTADALVLAELLAGVQHRIGRFFGPARVRGRKRRVKELWALPASNAALADAARAGARLDPGLAYRLLAYAVHPTCTRGYDFTIEHVITGAPSETWYLTAADGAGVSVSSSPPAEAPDATVTMSREGFDCLLRDQPVPAGRRPDVHGDHSAVAAMRGWTQRAQGR